MLEYDFEDSVGYWLHTAARAYERAINDELAPQGITWRQCQALGFLALEGPLAQTDLAERMRVEPPTLVGILDRMERDGWIRRDTCPTDRRRKLVHPQPAARPIWKKITAAARRVRARAADGLSASQLATLQQLLGVVQANLRAAAASREAI